MARPLKDGLLFFSFDTDFFFADKRIKALRARFGSDGLIFYIYLLTEIYRNGYYIRWDEDNIDNAMVDLGLTEGLIEQIMTFLAGRSLLTRSTLASSDTIITSPGIQKRYQEAVKGLKREVFVESEIWLLPDEETSSYIKFANNDSKSEKNHSKSEKNHSKSEKNSTKERKGKERKENESKEEKNVSSELDVDPPREPDNVQVTVVIPVITIILNDKTEHPVFQKEIDEWSKLYPAVDVMQELRNMKGWSISNPTKRKTKTGVNRFINSWLAKEQNSPKRKTKESRIANRVSDVDNW